MISENVKKPPPSGGGRRWTIKNITSRKHKLFERFFFDHVGAKKKGTLCYAKLQKESADKRISPSADGDEGFASSTAPPFEKVGRKLPPKMKAIRFIYSRKPPPEGGGFRYWDYSYR